MLYLLQSINLKKIFTCLKFGNFFSVIDIYFYQIYIIKILFRFFNVFIILDSSGKYRRLDCDYNKTLFDEIINKSKPVGIVSQFKHQSNSIFKDPYLYILIVEVVFVIITVG